MAEAKPGPETALSQAGVERNGELTRKLMEFLLSKPQLFNTLPDDFELIVLPEDDSEIHQYNLDLLDHYAAAEKTIVLARLASVQDAVNEEDVCVAYPSNKEGADQIGGEGSDR